MRGDPKWTLRWRRRVYPDAGQARREGETRGVARDQVLDLCPTSDWMQGPWPLLLPRRRRTPNDLRRSWWNSEGSAKAAAAGAPWRVHT